MTHRIDDAPRAPAWKEPQDMGDTGQVKVRIRSADDLLAVAEALEHEAAARYRELSAQMTRHGDLELAAQFGALAEMEDKHADQVAGRGRAMGGPRPDASRVRWEEAPWPDDERRNDVTLSAYKALAFAVRNEERAFAFFSYVAAEADDKAVRDLAESLARDELQHAAILRHYRRRAFHEHRPEAFEVPETADELRMLADRWNAEAAQAHRDLADRLAPVDMADATIFRRLAEMESPAASGGVAASAPKLRTALDGLRLLEERFDRYAFIAEHARDEAVIAMAQGLASVAISHLAAAGGARGNRLLDPGAEA